MKLTDETDTALADDTCTGMPRSGVAVTVRPTKPTGGKGANVSGTEAASLSTNW